MDKSPLIAGNKRLDAFSHRDFEAVHGFTINFPRLLTTPHVLAEVQNLCRTSIRGPALNQFTSEFADRVKTLFEVYEPAVDISTDPIFPSLGLTDAAIVRLAEQKKALVVTTDAGLTGVLEKKRLAVLNWNYWRQQQLGQ